MACRKNDFKLVKCLVENGADICARDSESLIISCNNWHYELFDYLIEKGANPLAQNNAPLRICCKNYSIPRFFPIIEYLVTKGAKLSEEDKD
jgi:ankyrin repeat protein